MVPLFLSLKCCLVLLSIQPKSSSTRSSLIRLPPSHISEPPFSPTWSAYSYNHLWNPFCNQEGSSGGDLRCLYLFWMFTFLNHITKFLRLFLRHLALEGTHPGTTQHSCGPDSISFSKTLFSILLFLSSS